MSPKEEKISDPEELFEHHRITVDPGQATLRMDVFLADRLPHISRNRIKNAAQAGCIRVNEKTAKASYAIKPRDVISVLLPYPPPPALEPEPVPLNIVHEDEDIIIINKPPGLVVHPGHNNYTGTLVHGLLYHFQHFPKNTGAAYRPGLVHRIDKDTSGLLVAAKMNSR